VNTDRTAAVALAATALLFAAVLARVAQLQQAPADQLRAFITDRSRDTDVDSTRGAIYDRRGRLLAASRAGQRLFLDPLRFPPDTTSALNKVAAASGYPLETLADRLLPRIEENLERRRDGRTLIRFVPVGGILPADRAQAVDELKIPGVHLERRPVRESVASASLAPLVGKVGFEHSGLLGLEHTFENDLAPEKGSASIVRDAQGSPLWVEGGAITAPHRGADLRLSIDSELQSIAKRALERGLEAADARAGRLIMVEPDTGEILAMLDLYRDVENTPFDPESIPEEEDDWPRYDVIPPDPKRETEPALARLRCVEDAYEPGSTFKPYIWSAALERQRATLDETLDTHHGTWRTSYGRLVEDVVKREEQSVFDVLVNSSNIGMTKLAERLSPAELQDVIRKFGFGAATGLPLPGEAAGLVTPPERWNKYTTTSVAFGYEVAVTPAQMIRAFCAFARNGQAAGTLPRLSIRAEPRTAPMLHRVIPAEVAISARAAMREVGRIMVERNQRHDRLPPGVPAYDLFGKSGTAKIPRPDGRGYFQKQYVSSFVAAAPALRPRVCVLVVIDDPGPARIAERSHYGSAVAGPVAAQVLHDALEYLGVPHDVTNEPDREMQQTAGVF